LLVDGFRGQQSPALIPEFLPGRICHQSDKVWRQSPQTSKFPQITQLILPQRSGFLNCQPTDEALRWQAFKITYLRGLQNAR